MKLDMEAGLGPGRIILDGDPALPKRGDSPQFSVHVYCDQPAGWIKMPLGTEVGFGLSSLQLYTLRLKNIIYFTALAVLRGRPHSA